MIHISRKAAVAAAAAAAATETGNGKGNAGRRRREKKSSRDELGGAARRVALQTNNLERLNPVKWRTSSPPPPLPRSFFVTRPPLPAMTRLWVWVLDVTMFVTFAKERIDESPKIVVNYRAARADMWRLAPV